MIRFFGYFQDIGQGARRAFLFLIFFMLMLGAANLLFTAREVNQQHRQTDTVCHFFADIGAVQVKVTPPEHHASELAVRLVAHSLTAWHGLHCPGAAPRPSASFARWARFYNIAVP